MKILLTTLNAKYIHKNLALRLLYVARNQDVDIKEYTIKEDIDKIISELVKSNYDVIAFSVYIWNVVEIRAIITKLKQQCNTHIIVGGPEVSYDIDNLLEIGVDAVCLGEGEVAFWKYIENLKNNVEEEIVGIHTKSFPNQQFAYVDLSYLQRLESPYFLPFDEADMKHRYFYLETSRGCPYACTYCVSGIHASVRMYDEEYIFKVLKQIATSDVRIVKLLDRTFNVNPTRALKIARYMNEHCVNQIFQFEIVAETLSEEMLTFFCEEADKQRFRFEVGVQSFHQPTLTAIQRIQNNERLIAVLRRLVSANVVMHVDLIAGLPFEDYATFKHSFNTLFHLHVSEIQLGILKLLKGTKIASQINEYEMRFNPLPPYDVKQTKWISEKELKQLNACAHAVEKTYNNQMLRYTIDHLVELNIVDDPFTLFVELGIRISTLKHPYQPHQICELLLTLVPHTPIVYGLINYDYFKIFKQRPKLFLKSQTSIQKKQEIIQLFIEKEILNQHQIYNYSYIDSIYYNNKLGYQLVLYNNYQGYPIRYFVDEDKIEVIK